VNGVRRVARIILTAQRSRNSVQDFVGPLSTDALGSMRRPSGRLGRELASTLRKGCRECGHNRSRTRATSNRKVREWRKMGTPVGRGEADSMDADCPT